MPSDHPHFPGRGKTGLLLVNLGTPDGTDTPSMRRYLKQFLSDRRVIEVPRLLWWVILNGIILNVRPRKSGDAYARIWLRMIRMDHRCAGSPGCRRNMSQNSSNAMILWSITPCAMVSQPFDPKCRNCKMPDAARLW